jgi:hypothetical protein
VKLVVLLSAIVLVFVCTTELQAQYAHNVSADSMLGPWNGASVGARYVWMPFRFTNSGTNDETDVSVIAFIKDHRDSVVYRDTMVINNWRSGEIRDTAFKIFNFSTFGGFRAYVITMLSSDQSHVDDTARATFFESYPYDLAADSILNPSSHEVKLQKVGFRVVAAFRAACLNEYFDVLVRVQIRDCVTGALKFSADTSISELHIESPRVTIAYPMSQGGYDMRKLPPGCYVVAVIARWPTDGDRTNDTAYSTFTIIPNTLDNDVAVDSIISPNGLMVQPNTTIPVTVRFRNTGKNIQVTATGYILITDRKGIVVDYDSITITNWRSGESRQVSFYSFTPRSYGIYSVLASIRIPNDDYELDDTAFAKLYCGMREDMASIAVVSPPEDTVIPYGSSFRIIGLFQWRGYLDTDIDIGVKAIITDTLGNPLYHLRNAGRYFASAALVTLDSPNITLTIPDTTALPISGLQPGKYLITLIGSDTVRSTFSVGLRYKIVVDSIGPFHYTDTIRDAPIRIKVYATNRGLFTSPVEHAQVEVDGDTGSIPFRAQSVEKDWKVGESRVISFSPYQPWARDTWKYVAVNIYSDSEVEFGTLSSSGFFYFPRSLQLVSEQFSNADSTSSQGMCEIYDLLGRCIFRGHQMDRPSLQTGTYFEKTSTRILKMFIR